MSNEKVEKTPEPNVDLLVPTEWRVPKHVTHLAVNRAGLSYIMNFMYVDPLDLNIAQKAREERDLEHTLSAELVARISVAPDKLLEFAEMCKQIHYRHFGHIAEQAKEQATIQEGKDE